MAHITQGKQSLRSHITNATEANEDRNLSPADMGLSQSAAESVHRRNAAENCISWFEILLLH